MTSVRCTRLDAAGNRGFSGARMVPGADVWQEHETSRSLDPDGWLVRRNGSRRHSNENTDASEITNRGWSVPIGTQRKKCQQLWKGEVLPLDGSLLMGGFSVPCVRPVFMRLSRSPPVKVL
jgi:hypothetical protein